MVMKMHRIDLKNKSIRFDLINDIKVDNIDKKKYKRVERITVNKNNCYKYNKAKGEYISIFFDDITDRKMKDEVVKITSCEIKRLLKRKKLLKKSVLVVGLGNDFSTPDSLGPKVVKNIINTRHISLISDLDDNYSVVSKIIPGVFANTGIESFDIVKSLVKSINPEYIIVIDALSSTSLNKVNKIIQITDSGIDPGSGVGNYRKEISKKTLGIDVISIGVPTVVSLHTIIKDILDEYDLDSVLDDKENYFVTPKEIDFVIEQLSFVISKSINNVLHDLTK